MGGNLSHLNTDEIKLESIQDVFQAVSKDKFLYNYCIGKGGFGKVWRVIRKKGK